MIKLIFIFFLVGGLARAEASSLLPLTEDIPLEPSIIISGNNLTFESKEGRIIIINAISPQSQEIIKNFYAMTLPNLGWKEMNTTTFVREKEKLEISFTIKEEKTYITFTVTPQKALIP